MDNSRYTKVSYQELLSTIQKILIINSVTLKKAKIIAEVLANTTLDGINSHGINRLPLLTEYIKKGHILVDAEPKIINSNNLFCQVDGCFGFGILNALFSTDKAVELALKNGIGLVSIKKTNHWHRAGTYGWKAVNKGLILIAWTNTMPNLAPYGSKENLIGNNPLVIAIPNKGSNVVLDMALSQFSYGTIANYARQEKVLPEIGGYDAKGNLTNNASEIRDGGKHLPIGFWKGSAISIVFDLVAAILSGGMSTNGLAENNGIDTGMSQIFIVIDPKKFGDKKFQQNIVNETLANFKEKSVRYPGEGVMERRKNNMKNGIPIEKEIWNNILKLSIH